MKVNLTLEQVLEYIIMGIENKSYQTAINIAKDCLNQLGVGAENSVQKSNEEEVEDVSLDSKIIKIVQAIYNNSSFTIETINEAVLVKLMALRGTPIDYDKTLRNIDRDYQNWIQDET